MSTATAAFQTVPRKSMHRMGVEALWSLQLGANLLANGSPRHNVHNLLALRIFGAMLIALELLVRKKITISPT